MRYVVSVLLVFLGRIKIFFAQCWNYLRVNSQRVTVN